MFVKKGQQVQFNRSVPDVLVDYYLDTYGTLALQGEVVSLFKRPVKYGNKIFGTWFAAVKVTEDALDKPFVTTYHVRPKDLIEPNGKAYNANMY